VLEELHVAGLGVIGDAWLEFAPGLNVLTGETGAGKTLVTVGLALSLGARASSGLVRPSGSYPSAASASVEARFDVGGSGDPELQEWADGGEIVLSRTVRADGKSSARIGGGLAALTALAGIGERLVEIHGQHHAERLLATAAQTDFVDRYAGPEHLETLQRYCAAHAALRRATARLEVLDREDREREREKDLLGYQIREIEAARVTPGEQAALAEEAARLTHAERIREQLAGAEDALAREDGAADGVRHAAGGLSTVASLDPGASGLRDRLASLVAETNDLLAELRTYSATVEMDPARLEEVRERIQALRSLERKYGEGEEGILSYLAKASARLASVESAEGERDELGQQVAKLRLARDELAAALTAGRSAAAPRLAERITAELQELGMPGATLTVALDPLPESGPGGAERAEFRFAGGPGQAESPLARSASGGELSRTMLACRSVLAALDDVPTLVFDEVDAGIGGRTAVAVAKRLAELARRRQVLVVTHLAQIAAHAERHFLVTKENGLAGVRSLEGDERVAEIARMLSGSSRDASLAHARDLLAQASGAPAAVAPEARPKQPPEVGSRQPAKAGRRGA
jgi:DNA repair protein RecN (Recombination protein N)